MKTMLQELGQSEVKTFLSEDISRWIKGNMKESWKTINELLNKGSKPSSIDCLKESGTETRNRNDVSNAMNNFFCTIGRELADKIQPASNPLLSGEY